MESIIIVMAGVVYMLGEVRVIADTMDERIKNLYLSDLGLALAIAGGFTPAEARTRKIPLIKIFRTVQGCGLKEAKDLIEIALHLWENEAPLANKILEQNYPRH